MSTTTRTTISMVLMEILNLPLRSRFRGSTILELGAGTSWPGLVAAKVGANVTLTDDSSKPEVLDNMTRICELNKLNCNVIYGLQLSSSLFSLCWPSLVPFRMISLPPSHFCFKVLQMQFLSQQELGAGTSWPGLVAAKVGANVTLTDDSSKPEVLDNMTRVCELKAQL
ncbi:unnamed protein product [Brassica oleracea]